MTCYEKNQYWAQCKASCTPGIDPNDPIEYRTPWTCTSETREACSSNTQNCRDSRCCQDPSMTCYEKNEYWAQCKASCTPGIDPNDPAQYQTPWSCSPLAGLDNSDPVTTTGSDSDGSCSSASTNCMTTRCCNDPSMTCYEKNQYWAQCKASCTPGIDPNDPIEYRTPWTCTSETRDV